MTGELLDGSCRRPTHRQVRTERVPQNVNPWPYVRSSGCPPHQHLDDFLSERLSRSIAEHARAAQVSSIPHASVSRFLKRQICAMQGP
jgi:hypothetical protein